MEEKTIFETHVEDVLNNSWLWCTVDDNNCNPVGDDKSVMDAALIWEMTPAAVTAIKDAFDYLADELVCALKKDLIDLYNK
jgi:hypothetical protein